MLPCPAAAAYGLDASSPAQRMSRSLCRARKSATRLLSDTERAGLPERRSPSTSACCCARPSSPPADTIDGPASEGVGGDVGAGGGAGGGGGGGGGGAGAPVTLMALQKKAVASLYLPAIETKRTVKP